MSRAESSSGKTKGYKSFSIWLIGLLLIAYALRIFKLDEQSIWWDEGISMHLAVSSVADIFGDRLSNIHPPLYFVFLKGWLLLTGVNAFGARYLSVLASWLQVVVIYAIASRWFSWRTGAGAVLLAVFSAVSTIYGQEARVYAILALVYLLLLAVTRELTLTAVAGDKRRTILWISLGLITWFGLHLHYIVLFVVGYVSIWALIVFIKHRRWQDMRRWLLVFVLIGLASFPWFLSAWSNWKIVRSEALAGTFGTDPAPISFLTAQVWTFHLTGLAGSLARPGIATLAAITAVVLFVLVIIRLLQKGTRRNTAVLIAHWLVPLSSALVVWTIRSFSHPRYVSMFAPGLLLLAAYAMFPPKAELSKQLKRLASMFSIVLFVGIVLSSLVGLWLYLIVPEVAKDDMRGVARYLEAKAEAKDLILIPDTDWSLPFEYEGEAKVSMPGLDDPADKWTNLASLTTDVRRAFLVDYQNGTRDWQGVLFFALNTAGSMTSEEVFDGLVVQSFLLDERISEPEIRSDQIDFGSLKLTGSWIEPEGKAGEALTIALRWQLIEPIDKKAQVSLRILDGKGWSLASSDAMLLDAYGRPPSNWIVGDPVTTYHVIAVPPAVPPLDYDVEVQVYLIDEEELQPLSVLDEQGAPKGRSSIIGNSQLSFEQQVQETSKNDLPIPPWASPRQVAAGLTLLAADVETDLTIPGELLHVQLLWQAMSDPMPDYQTELALVQGNSDIVINRELPVYGRYPTRNWSPGEKVFERRGLLVPPEAAGDVTVVLRLGDDEIVLGEVNIKAQDYSFVQPSSEYQMDIVFDDLAQISGFNLSGTTVKEGEPIQLELVWQSLKDGSKTDYVVFTHLLAEDGHLIGQHDGRPAEGTRPTTGWRKGEFITDKHEISFTEDGYRGQALIEIGLYDPVSSERLKLTDDSDFLILPVTLTIE